MQLLTIEHSPFPAFESMKTINLKFSKAEIAALKRAAAILEKADDLVLKHYRAHDTESDVAALYSLDDYDRDMASILTNHTIIDCLDSHETHGIKIDNLN